MLSPNINAKEKRKEIRKLITNLSKRVNRIEALGDKVPQYATKSFRSLQKKIPKRLTSLDDEELTKLHRNLRYINSLKTSTVKGAIKAQEEYEPIKAKIQALSPEKRREFNRIYNKLYEETGNLTERFRYEVYGTAIDYVYGGVDIDEVYAKVKEIFDEAYEEVQLGGFGGTDEALKISFTAKLDELRKQIE